jgi:hypothetical protein
MPNRLLDAGLKDFERGRILRAAGGQDAFGAEGQPRFGSCKGSLVILAEDDELLNDFAEYTRLETLQFPEAADSFSSLPHFVQRRGEQTRQYSLPHCGQGACPSGLTMCN